MRRWPRLARGPPHWNASPGIGYSLAYICMNPILLPECATNFAELTNRERSQRTAGRYVEEMEAEERDPLHPTTMIRITATTAYPAVSWPSSELREMKRACITPFGNNTSLRLAETPKGQWSEVSRNSRHLTDAAPVVPHLSWSKLKLVLRQNRF